jgi:hypothetical protein
VQQKQSLLIAQQAGDGRRLPDPRMLPQVVDDQIVDGCRLAGLATALGGPGRSNRIEVAFDTLQARLRHRRGARIFLLAASSPAPCGPDDASEQLLKKY